MHEANFTEQIVESIFSELKKHPELRATRIKVRVGEMLHLNQESVKWHYDLLAKGTALEGVVLDLEELGTRVKCRNCKWEGGVLDHHLLMCSSCNSHDVELLSGKEILIDAIELEDQ